MSAAEAFDFITVSSTDAHNMTIVQSSQTLSTTSITKPGMCAVTLKPLMLACP